MSQKRSIFDQPSPELWNAWVGRGHSMVKLSPYDSVLRKCLNIKSKKHTDQRCNAPATYGEFCEKHIQHPTRYPVFKDRFFQSTRSLNQSTSKLQAMYRFRRGLRRARVQGPATTAIDLAENSTELSSFDATSSIPCLYRFSYADEKKHIWLFDIRSLVQLLEQKGLQIQNPYTREPFPPKILKRLQDRIAFLRTKQYCLLWPQGDDKDQVLHQRVVDVCLKFDALGYYTSPSWFEDLSLLDLKMLYCDLYDTFLMDIPEIQRRKLVPSFETMFPLRLSGISMRKDAKPLHLCVLTIFESLVTKPKEADSRSLGAMISLRVLAKRQPAIYGNYSWLQAS